jgi:hypothetical protein
MRSYYYGLTHRTFAYSRVCSGRHPMPDMRSMVMRRDTRAEADVSSSGKSQTVMDKMDSI